MLNHLVGNGDINPFSGDKGRLLLFIVISFERNLYFVVIVRNYKMFNIKIIRSTFSYTT